MRVSKRSQRRREIQALDRLFRELIYLRDKGTCQYSGKQGRGVQVAHVFSRSRFSVRWDEDNALLLAAGVHLYWAHKHPLQFHEFIKKRLGPERYNRLLIRSEQSAAGQDLAAVRLHLVQRITELEQQAGL